MDGNCAGTHSIFGKYSQLPPAQKCPTVCATYPVGQPGASDGNSLGCRATKAKQATREKSTCSAAAYYGGENDECGSGCEAYCNVMVKACPSLWGQYTGLGQAASMCVLLCNGMGQRVLDAGAQGAVDGDSLWCRGYYALDALFSLAATGVPDDAKCEQANITSPVCTDNLCGVYCATLQTNCRNAGPAYGRTSKP
jgi:hypothetical protein